MADLLGFDIKNPAVYVAVNVAVWVGMFSLISIFFGDSLLDAVIPGFFGGLSFGIFSWYLQSAAEP